MNKNIKSKEVKRKLLSGSNKIVSSVKLKKEKDMTTDLDLSMVKLEIKNNLITFMSKSKPTTLLDFIYKFYFKFITWDLYQWYINTFDPDNLNKIFYKNKNIRIDKPIKRKKKIYID